MHGYASYVTALCCLLSLAPQALAQTATRPGIAKNQAVIAQNGMVVTEESRATRVGVEILKRGGNAVDAAVAVGFAMAVTYPTAGNIGGGGFMLVRLAERNQIIVIDYRETAPIATTKDIFLNFLGQADPKKSRDEGLAIGVPGTVAGLALAHQKYGSGNFTLAELIAPAIKLAREGIVVDVELADSLVKSKTVLERWPSTAAIFLRADGSLPQQNELFVQRDLASTLETIAQQGPRAFYEGPIAQAIAQSVQQAGGIMTAEDLGRYQAVERTPVRGSYREYDIYSIPPPSAGGVHLIQILNILDGFDLAPLGPNSGQAAHIKIEAMKLAYADRAKFLGDPDQVKVPVAGLISRIYAGELRKKIDPDKGLKAADLGANMPSPLEGDHTTHFSIVDRDGNAVANTYTLNLRYGTGLVADGTGVLLNNELDDFAAKPGAPNAFGLTGGAANAPASGKKPLSSMAPTFVMKGRDLVLVTGSPGGSRIITIVANVIVNVIDYRMSLADAVAAPRIHHQWMPDEVRVEPDILADMIFVLERRGNKVTQGAPWGSANSILVTQKNLQGVADPRSRGAKAEGF
jgi:gamma-glutamyltranspeptidase/glutathione hydrolase